MSSASSVAFRSSSCTTVSSSDRHVLRHSLKIRSTPPFTILRIRSTPWSWPETHTHIIACVYPLCVSQAEIRRPSCPAYPSPARVSGAIQQSLLQRHGNFCPQSLLARWAPKCRSEAACGLLQNSHHCLVHQSSCGWYLFGILALEF